MPGRREKRAPTCQLCRWLPRSWAGLEDCFLPSPASDLCNGNKTGRVSTPLPGMRLQTLRPFPAQIKSLDMTERLDL